VVAEGVGKQVWICHWHAALVTNNSITRTLWARMRQQAKGQDCEVNRQEARKRWRTELPSSPVEHQKQFDQILGEAARTPQLCQAG
jgi:hypothetical protein